MVQFTNLISLYDWIYHRTDFMREWAVFKELGLAISPGPLLFFNYFRTSGDAWDAIHNGGKICLKYNFIYYFWPQQFQDNIL